MNRSARGLMMLLLATIAACGGDATGLTDSGAMSPAARTYLNSALDVMQNFSFYRKTIDWQTLRANAIAAAEAAQAQTPSATYPAIRTALIALGDHHSFLQPPVSGAVAPFAAAAAVLHPADSLDSEIIGGRYGYLRIPTYAPTNGGTSAQSTAFADTLQALVKATDVSAPCGWVVDLRHNGGGNMWPMLVGVGPILGEGVNLGAFVDANGVLTRWYYLNGSAGTMVGEDVPSAAAARTSRTAYGLKKPLPAVAVLTDARTASSGEAIAVAFRGRAGARTFGVATYGVPTANASHTLADGAVIWLMSALDMDRTGRQYVDPLPPDEVIATTANPATDDAVVSAATTWLSAQSACKN